MGCKHEWKEGKRTLGGTATRECKKCGRVEYLVSKPVGSTPRWRLNPW